MAIKNRTNLYPLKGSLSINQQAIKNAGHKIPATEL